MSIDPIDSNRALSEPDAGRRHSQRLERLILSQPDLVSAAITGNFDSIREAAALVAAARRVRLAGSGHSAAIADIGAYLLRAVGIDARASHAFDLATYPPGFDASDLVVAVASQDDRAYASRVVQRANHAGLPAIAIVTPPGRISNATVTVSVGADDESPTGLTWLPAGIAALAAIVARVETRSALAESLPALREIVRTVLTSREIAADVARAVAAPDRRTLIVGAGPALPLARAGALAVAEAGDRLASAQHIEDAMLGGLRALQRGDLIVQIAPAGPAEPRHRDLARICSAVGIERWRIGGAADGARWHSDLPPVDEGLAPIAAAVPLLWLAQSVMTDAEIESTTS